MERKDREARNAFVLYLALTIALTWPVATGLTHLVPGDFGDPLFSSWALAWDVTHLGRGWWHANIFAPHPLALAYSEHFLPQALQALPVYLLTGNPILCYNLLFLSTFVLSGFGMFLLGRELTGNATAGLVAGLAFAFAPYRVSSIPHMQVLSSAWMPFVLFGLRRYFTTGRTRPLAGAAVAWLVQNLSCGYYLLFFSPVVGIYIVWEMTTRRLWTDRRTLLLVAGAVSVVLAATIPFLLPYLELRSLGFSPRSSTETRKFSADVYAYFTADPNLRLWGSIAQAWPRSEGLLFPGLTISVLAALGLAPKGPAKAGHYILLALGAIVLALLLGFSIRLPGIRITSFSRALIVCGVAGAGVVWSSRDRRETARRWLASPAGIFSLITLFAIVMSFGPEIHAKGREVASTNLYAAFYSFVPGFDGVRVPARYAMIATLGLAALAGIAVAALDPRHQRRAAAIAGALIVIEAIAIPIPTNQHSTDYAQRDLAPLPATVGVGSQTPAVYAFVAQLPPSAVIMELPLGEPAFDVRYMFYSTQHWKPLVNGYSGGAPPEYGMLTEALKDRATRPDRAWQAIAGSTATHAIVHEASYSDEHGPQLSRWLESRGAREVASFGSDHVFLIRYAP